MATQNLVSASITPEVKTKVLKEIGDIRSELGFLLTLGTEELQGLFKVGKEFRPFLDDCHKVVQEHSEILTSAFNMTEFENDYRLFQDLEDLFRPFHELHEALFQTLKAVGSDTLGSCLDIYGASKFHKDKIPGMDAVADRMAQYFK